jgi:hypothetical protein
LFRRLVLLLLLIAGATHSTHAVVNFVAERPVSQGADRSKVCFPIPPNAVTLRRDDGVGTNIPERYILLVGRATDEYKRVG